MGSIEIISDGTLQLRAHIITYGNAASSDITLQMAEEIEDMWNEAQGSISFAGKTRALQFRISAACIPHLYPEEVYENQNPQNNYFRIEEYAQGNISFVDGNGCNTGYFKLENLYKGSTTAAHEFGHTLGLPHPNNLDYRSRGIPGIMYPRGTLVDPNFQYDPAANAGQPGGTLNPIYRKVKKEEIAMLKVFKVFNTQQYIMGDFSSVWHNAHRQL